MLMSSPVAAFEDKLGAHELPYEIVERLGAGGMGEVSWRATSASPGFAGWSR